MDAIKIDKEALREMIRAAVAKKLGNVQEGLRVRGSDRDVITSFLAHEPMEGNKLSTDGNRLDGLWMGGSGIAEWEGQEIKFNELGSKSAQTVQKAIKSLQASQHMMEGKGKPTDKSEKHDKVGKKHQKDAENKKDAKKEIKGALKISKSKLAEAVVMATRQALKEAKEAELGPYATKVDKFVSDSIDSIDSIIKEGEDLMAENPTHDYAIQERNHMIQARIGILKGVKNNLVKIMEDLYSKV